MTVQIDLGKGPLILAEMQEFGSFPVETQVYIRRSLDVAFSNELDIGRWARSEDEADSIRVQRNIYRVLSVIRRSTPFGSGLPDADSFLFPLIAVAVFDLSGGELETFAQFRFLYERLLGARSRPWLQSAFATAAALPHQPLERREAYFASLGGTFTDRWSASEPAFFPKWFAGCDESSHSSRTETDMNDL
jgi:hypothetical protein